MKKNPHGRRVMMLILIFVCVALIFAAAWGIVTGISKLMHYGETTTVQKEETKPDNSDAEQEETEEESEEEGM